MYVLVFDDYCEDDGQKKPISCEDKYLLEEEQKDTAEICYSKTI